MKKIEITLPISILLSVLIFSCAYYIVEHQKQNYNEKQSEIKSQARIECAEKYKGDYSQRIDSFKVHFEQCLNSKGL